MTLADRIAVMDRGRIAQVGPPRQVYEHPHNVFVCDFLGEANILDGALEKNEKGRIVVEIGGDSRVVAEIDDTVGAFEIGDPITVAVRPEKVRLHRALVDAPISLSGQIQHIAYVGTSQNYYVTMETGNQMIVFEQSGLHAEPPAIGDRVFLTWESGHTLILKRSGNR